MRPIFCGNFEYDARESDLERLFSRYGKVDRVDMKSGIPWSTHALPGRWAVRRLFWLSPSLFFVFFQKG